MLYALLHSVNAAFIDYCIVAIFAFYCVPSYTKHQCENTCQSEKTMRLDFDDIIKKEKD